MHGIPNLEKQIATSPAMFVQAVAMVFKRDDNGEDPLDWRVDDPERQTAIARAVHRLLKQLRRIPGTRDDGHIDSDALGTWLAEVGSLFAQHGRAEIGDYWIGKLLSEAPH